MNLQVLADLAHVDEPVETEGQYHALWLERVTGVDDLLDQAVLGGLLADRFAWVFLAGYQPAMNHTFGDGVARDWSAFAVSEDRTGELAPVTWVAQGDEYLLNGYKTWVAGVEHMRHIVVKAGRGRKARFFVVERTRPGLELRTKPEGFLPEMTEGIAHFYHVRVGEDDRADTSELERFGSREFLYIYAAFCGLLIGKCEAPECVADARGLLEDIGLCIADPADTDRLKAIDSKLQALRKRAGPHMRDVVGWEADQRLIAIYSKPIQSR
jgi:hypothetical protein